MRDGAKIIGSPHHGSADEMKRFHSRGTLKTDWQKMHVRHASLITKGRESKEGVRVGVGVDADKDKAAIFQT